MNDFPYVGPPADGLVQAMTAARSRRLRKASASSGASALALTLVAVLASTPGRTTLSQDPTPEQPAVVVNVVPDGKTRTTTTPAQGLDVALSAPGTTTAGAGSFAPQRTGSPLLSGGQHELGSGSTQGRGGHRGPAAAPYKAGPISRDVNTSSIVSTCAISGDGQSYTSCPLSQMNDKSDGTTDLQLQYCNNDTQPLRLTFPNANEVDFAVFTEKPNEMYVPDKQVWRWSDTNPQRESRHQVTLDSTQCATWTFPYTLVDGSGRPLPKGTYLLRAVLHASSPSGRTVPDYRFTVS